MSGVVKVVTDKSFVDDVLLADGPVLVDFWAPWCAPCRKLTPVLDQIAAQSAGKLMLVKVDVDQNPETARQYDITSIPTIAVFAGGRPVKTIVGARPKAALLRELAEFLDR